MKEIARSAIVEHSAAKMYALVDDIEAYPRFLPWCLEAKVDDSGGRKRATLTAGMAGLRPGFNPENENQPDRGGDVPLLGGPVLPLSGALTLAALRLEGAAVALA